VSASTIRIQEDLNDLLLPERSISVRVGIPRIFVSNVETNVKALVGPECAKNSGVF
jgi:hypothetical protein